MISISVAGDVLVSSGTSPASRLQYPDHRTCAFLSIDANVPEGRGPESCPGVDGFDFPRLFHNRDAAFQLSVVFLQKKANQAIISWGVLIMRIYFWQNTFAMHQVHCLKALAERNEVRWLVDREIQSDRASQGWSRPEMGRINAATVRPDEVSAILAEAGNETLHVFAPRGAMTGPGLLSNLTGSRKSFALLAEIPCETGFRLVLREWLYRYLAWRCRNARFFVAMGDHGAVWYANRGFKRVFAFGYTVEDSVLPVLPRRDGAYRFVCVAQLIRRKGIDILLRALTGVRGEWTLTCIGRGKDEALLKALSMELKLEARVSWIRTSGNREARQYVADSDTLILASRWDGWGAVVNEAIAEGTRVVVSDMVGAGCLLQLGDVGEVVPVENVPELTAALQRQLNRGVVESDERSARRALHSRVNGPAMPTYFEQIAFRESPAARWTAR